MRPIPNYHGNQILLTLFLLLVLPSQVAPMESSTLNQQTPHNQNQQRRSLQAAPDSFSEGKVLFETFDKDHNEMLDRQEYLSLWSRVQNDVKDKSPSTTATIGDSIGSLFSKTSGKTNGDDLKFWPAFVNSLSMIIATEIGDKTFFIAAVLSMKNDRFSVFGGAILALIVMTILR